MKTKPKATHDDDYPVVPPPATVQVPDKQVLLYKHKPDGTPLVRKIGF